MSDVVLELFTKFIDMRREGCNRDYAWDQILRQADDLSEKKMQRLLQLSKNWELKEGYLHQNRHSDPAATILHRPDNLKLKLAALQQGEKLEIDNITVELNVAPSVEPRHSPSYFGDESWLVISIPDGRPIALKVPQGREYIIGRVTNNTTMAPDIDLSAMQAGKFGVSRVHAAIEQRNQTLVISDLGSMNFTHVNGQRLHPHEVRVLNSGDELRFGWLNTRVQFKHAP